MSVPLPVYGRAYRERLDAFGVDKSVLAQMLGISTRALRKRCQENAVIRIELILALERLEHLFAERRNELWIKRNQITEAEETSGADGLTDS